MTKASHLHITVWGRKEGWEPIIIGKAEVDIHALEYGHQSKNYTLNSLSITRPKIHLDMHLSPLKKSVTIEDFEMLSMLGKGGYGRVFIARKKDTRRIYAVKEMKKEYLQKTNSVGRAVTESNTLAKLSHPFIVSLAFSFQTESCVYLVMDYLNGGEIYTHLAQHGAFGEDRTRFYAAQMALALIYLHDKKIIYRDMKVTIGILVFFLLLLVNFVLFFSQRIWCWI